MRKTIVLNVIILCLFSFTPLIAQGKKIGWLLEAGVGLKSGETRYNSAQVFISDNETHTRESDPSIETFSLRLGWFF